MKCLLVLLALLELGSGFPKIFSIYGHTTPSPSEPDIFNSDILCREMKSAMQHLILGGVLECGGLAEEKSVPEEVLKFCSYSGSSFIRDCFSRPTPHECLMEVKETMDRSDGYEACWCHAKFEAFRSFFAVSYLLCADDVSSYERDGKMFNLDLPTKLQESFGAFARTMTEKLFTPDTTTTTTTTTTASPSGSGNCQNPSPKSPKSNSKGLGLGVTLFCS